VKAIEHILEQYLEPKHVRGGPRSRPYESTTLQMLLEHKLVVLAVKPCAHAPWVACHYYFLSEEGCRLATMLGLQPRVCGQADFAKWYASEWREHNGGEARWG
jgi:hypothetical protein